MTEGAFWKSASSFDAREGIQVNGHFFKLISFYDNEWGYTSQIFRLISAYVPGGPWCKIKQIVNEKVKRISAVTVRSHERKSIT
ncbi:MAG: hypothetical protein ACLR2O_06910 [Coprococcus sp.]